jgi:hypothetical protein
MHSVSQLPPLFNLIAPRTAHKGLLANNPWLPAACTRAVGLFANKSLHAPALVLASVHEAAIDYISQAPVLVVAAAGKSDLALRQHREAVAARFKLACSFRPRLKELMRFYHLAPQLRVLAGHALRPQHFCLLAPLSSIPPSRLAQAIPSAREDQIAWLTAVDEWRSLAQRHTSDTDWIVAWAGANACQRHSRSAASDIIDFALHDRQAFNSEWSLAEATAACDRWHGALVQRSFEASYTHEQLNAVADYGPLPDEAVVDDHTFLALRTRAQIFAEGRAMRHCVATYAATVFAGRCWLYSVMLGGNRVATLELRQTARGFALIQIKAQFNRPPPAATMIAADRLVAQVNAALAVAPVRHSAGAARQQAR